MMQRRRGQAMVFGALVTGLVALLPVGPAGAQTGDDVVGEVEISFDVGDFDPTVGDWTIDAVVVSGDLEDGIGFTIEVTGASGEVLWSATQPFDAPVTRIPVPVAVAVADVADAGVSQGITAVAGVQVEPPTVDWSASGGGGAGQLALSMVMAVLLVAIVFRTPLPSATTRRWTK